MTERMVTSETGGRKGAKPAQLSTVDPQALLVLAEVGGKGAEKYEPHNYLKGYDWSLSFNALQRHALAFWNGEDTDPESGLPHMGHAAWHALALVSFLTRGLGTDDRFKQEPTVTVEEYSDGVTMEDGVLVFEDVHAYYRYPFPILDDTKFRIRPFTEAATPALLARYPGTP